MAIVVAKKNNPTPRDVEFIEESDHISNVRRCAVSSLAVVSLGVVAFDLIDMPTYKLDDDDDHIER